MLPFIGYHMADYWNHWLEMGKRGELKLPRIYRVNWFRRDENKRFAWPGYGQNMRVLKWIVDRVRGRASAVDGAFGRMPRYGDLTWKGLDFDRAAYAKISDIRKDDAQREVDGVRRWLPKLGDRLPLALRMEVARLDGRVGGQPPVWRAE